MNFRDLVLSAAIATPVLGGGIASILTQPTPAHGAPVPKQRLRAVDPVYVEFVKNQVQGEDVLGNDIHLRGFLNEAPKHENFNAGADPDVVKTLKRLGDNKALKHVDFDPQKIEWNKDECSILRTSETMPNGCFEVRAIYRATAKLPDGWQLKLTYDWPGFGMKARRETMELIPPNPGRGDNPKEAEFTYVEVIDEKRGQFPIPDEKHVVQLTASPKGFILREDFRCDATGKMPEKPTAQKFFNLSDLNERMKKEGVSVPGR